MRILIILAILTFKLCWGTHIEGVPFVKQKDEYCGPASLSSVLSYYGHNISQEEIAKHVYIKELKGALITDLENFANRLGFKTILKSSNIDEIKGFLEEKKPVIALIDIGFWVVSKPHYVVIVGYDEKNFIVHTGYEAGKKIDYREFEERWKKLGNVILVVYR